MFFKQNLNFLGAGNFVNAEVCGEIPLEQKNQLLKGSADPSPEELILISDHYGIPVDRLLRINMVERSGAPKLKLIIFDVDGVLTDGGMYYTESGDEFKKFNAKDGLAIRRLAKEGFVTGIISHGINRKLITRRAALLDITRVYAGDKPKTEVFREWCAEMGIGPESAGYIGDDVNDLPVIGIAGFTACPADAVDAVKNVVDIVLSKKGGEGCVREWIDEFILKTP